MEHHPDVLKVCIKEVSELGQVINWLVLLRDLPADGRRQGDDTLPQEDQLFQSTCSPSTRTLATWRASDPCEGRVAVLLDGGSVHCRIL